VSKAGPTRLGSTQQTKIFIIYRRHHNILAYSFTAVMYIKMHVSQAKMPDRWKEKQNSNNNNITNKCLVWELPCPQFSVAHYGRNCCICQRQFEKCSMSVYNNYVFSKPKARQLNMTRTEKDRRGLELWDRQPDPH